MSSSNRVDEIFDKFLSGGRIFINRDVLRHDYIPDKLPHRAEHIQRLANILAPSLNGSKISNAFIYGKTGTGKTAVAKYVLTRLKKKADSLGTPLKVCYINCRLAGTNYRVLADLCKSLKINVPFTGLAVSELLERYKENLNLLNLNEIVTLDEIDFLVKRNEDSLLYELTRINEFLKGNWVGLIGISNDLRFKEYLDARVLSCLSEEEVIFKPYSADELYDILFDRAKRAFVEGALQDSSLKLCAAYAAREHGDARRALDLLRVAGELAEREGLNAILDKHVKEALQKIEDDRLVEALKYLPLHQKIILIGVYHLDSLRPEGSVTGDLYEVYSELCASIFVEPLTQRRVSGLLNELDILGLLNTRVVSFGRYGRTKKIKLGISSGIIAEVLSDDDIVGSLLRHEAKLKRKRG
ncbi:MAG: orc1/cdc6 family replication initiation protein [Candidatus Bathyarchaeia archaeon]